MANKRIKSANQIAHSNESVNSNTATFSAESLEHRRTQSESDQFNDDSDISANTGNEANQDTHDSSSKDDGAKVSIDDKNINILGLKVQRVFPNDTRQKPECTMTFQTDDIVYSTFVNQTPIKSGSVEYVDSYLSKAYKMLTQGVMNKSWDFKLFSGSRSSNPSQIAAVQQALMRMKQMKTSFSVDNILRRSWGTLAVNADRAHLSSNYGTPYSMAAIDDFLSISVSEDPEVRNIILNLTVAYAALKLSNFLGNHRANSWCHVIEASGSLERVINNGFASVGSSKSAFNALYAYEKIDASGVNDLVNVHSQSISDVEIERLIANFYTGGEQLNVDQNNVFSNDIDASIKRQFNIRKFKGADADTVAYLKRLLNLSDHIFELAGGTIVTSNLTSSSTHGLCTATIHSVADYESDRIIKRIIMRVDERDKKIYVYTPIFGAVISYLFSIFLDSRSKDDYTTDRIHTYLQKGGEEMQVNRGPLSEILSVSSILTRRVKGGSNDPHSCVEADFSSKKITFTMATGPSQTGLLVNTLSYEHVSKYFLLSRSYTKQTGTKQNMITELVTWSNDAFVIAEQGADINDFFSWNFHQELGVDSSAVAQRIRYNQIRSESDKLSFVITKMIVANSTISDIPSDEQIINATTSINELCTSFKMELRTLENLQITNLPEADANLLKGYKDMYPAIAFLPDWASVTSLTQQSILLSSPDSINWDSDSVDLYNTNANFVGLKQLVRCEPKDIDPTLSQAEVEWFNQLPHNMYKLRWTDGKNGDSGTCADKQCDLQSRLGQVVDKYIDIFKQSVTEMIKAYRTFDFTQFENLICSSFKEEYDLFVLRFYKALTSDKNLMMALANGNAFDNASAFRVDSNTASLDALRMLRSTAAQLDFINGLRKAFVYFKFSDILSLLWWLVDIHDQINHNDFEFQLPTTKSLLTSKWNTGALIRGLKLTIKHFLANDVNGLRMLSDDICSELRAATITAKGVKLDKSYTLSKDDCVTFGLEMEDIDDGLPHASMSYIPYEFKDVIKYQVSQPINSLISLESLLSVLHRDTVIQFVLDPCNLMSAKQLELAKNAFTSNGTVQHEFTLFYSPSLYSRYAEGIQDLLNKFVAGDDSKPITMHGLQSFFLKDRVIQGIEREIISASKQISLSRRRYDLSIPRVNKIVGLQQGLSTYKRVLNDESILQLLSQGVKMANGTLLMRQIIKKVLLDQGFLSPVEAITRPWSIPTERLNGTIAQLLNVMMSFQLYNQITTYNNDLPIYTVRRDPDMSNVTVNQMLDELGINPHYRLTAPEAKVVQGCAQLCCLASVDDNHRCWTIVDNEQLEADIQKINEVYSIEAYVNEEPKYLLEDVIDIGQRFKTGQDVVFRMGDIISWFSGQIVRVKNCRRGRYVTDDYGSSLRDIIENIDISVFLRIEYDGNEYDAVNTAVRKDLKDIAERIIQLS